MASQEEDLAFETWWQATPESKLELIDGKLVINTLAGSRRIAWTLLDDYGPAIALPITTDELWWASLRQAYEPRPELVSPHGWAVWAENLVYDPEPPPAGPRGTHSHYRTYQLLSLALHHFAEASGLGRCLGRDFAIRLGEDALTPDLSFVDRTHLAKLREYYLNGPPALIIEIVHRGSAESDRKLKRQLYERAGVSEYWIIEPEVEEAVFLSLDEDGRYEQMLANSDGVYHAATVPGLALSLPHLWTVDGYSWREPFQPLLPPLYTDSSPLPERETDLDELGWDALPFTPRVGLEPVQISFDEYISWCPEAKFERDSGGMVIASHEGTRRVMGLLLMTLGLVEIVKLAHPREWVTFLQRNRYESVVQKHKARLLSHAHYEAIEVRPGEVFYHGEVKQLPALSTYGDTLTECKRNLEEMASNWILLRVARRQEVSKHP